MRTFSLFTTDTRYLVPTFTLLIEEDDRQAIARAKANLLESRFHRAVELHDGHRRIYRGIRLEDRRAFN